MRFFTKTHMEFAQIMSELQNSKCPPTMWDIELSDILPGDVEDMDCLPDQSIAMNMAKLTSTPKDSSAVTTKRLKVCIVEGWFLENMAFIAK